LDNGFSGPSPLTIFYYNSQLLFHHLTITVYIAIDISHCLQFTTHALSLISLLSHTSSLVPAFKCGRSPFWVPKYPRFTGTATPDSQCSPSSGMPILSRPVLSRALPITAFLKLCQISRSQITTDSQSASQSWCQAPICNP
jgi:hypothetical protein